jgi:hypothetical protein
VLVGAAGVMMLGLGSAQTGAPAARPAATSATAPTSQGSRLTYPKGHLPRITLADGEQRQIRSLLKVDHPLHYGDYVWDDAAVPAGDVWVRVDLQRQILSVFRGGHEIGTAVIVYGTDGKATPRGVFPVIEKARYHRSSTYDADMPFMLRLTSDGVAVHASMVRQGAATHGCIGVPSVFARLLFAQVKRGDEVAIS